MGRSGKQKTHDKSSDDSNSALKRFLKIIGVIFDTFFFLTAGAVIGAFIFYTYMSSSHKFINEVRIPQVKGKSGQLVIEILSNLGLKPVLKAKRCENVLGTYPRAGIKVKKGREVEIYCLETAVDDLIKRVRGVPFEYVADTLMGLGMKYEISKIPYPGEDGRVIQAVYMDKKFFLLIDGGEPKRFIKVEDYTGMSVKESEKILEESEVNFRVEGKGEKVISQYPQPGSISDEVVLITE
jgi:beta-lactam-binding protein with PASTA domain